MNWSGLRSRNAAWWAWLGAVLGGPFVSALMGNLFASHFRRPFSEVQAMIIIGLPAWGFIILLSSAWLATKTPPKAGDGFLVTLFANFVFGVFASIAWGFAGCSALAYVSQKLR